MEPQRIEYFRREIKSALEREAVIQAKIDADGIPRCFMCGDTAEACDAKAAESGFDECEWLAEK